MTSLGEVFSSGSIRSSGLELICRDGSTSNIEPVPHNKTCLKICTGVETDDC